MGTPEQWEEDPVAAGTYAVLSIGSFFIPVAGQAGAAAKVTSSLTRAATATGRLAGIAVDGGRLANGLTHTGALFTRLSTAVDGLTSGALGLRGLTEVASALDGIPDVVPDNLVAARAAVDTPQVEANAGGRDIPLGRPGDAERQSGTTSADATPQANGGSVSVLERTDGGGTGNGNGGPDGSGADNGSSESGTTDGVRADGDGAGPLPTPDEVRAAVETGNARETAASFDSRVEEVQARYPEVSAENATSIANYERLIDSGRYEPYIVRFFDGSIFSLENAHRYTANEVYLDVGGNHNAVRLDSYTPGDAVVSRKNTQLAEQPQGALAALREMNAKYDSDNPEIVIADTPNNRANFPPDRIGKPLRGGMRLEVPVQNGAVPQKVLALAKDLRIEIVDVTGKVYR